MAYDYFVIDDRDSRDFNVFLYNKDTNNRLVYFGSESNIVTENILGKDGELLFNQKNVAKPFKLECICFYDYTYDVSEINKMTAWLQKKGVRKLSLSYEIYKYREVVVTGVSNIVDYGNQGFKFSLEIKPLSPYSFSHFTTLELETAQGEGIIYDDRLAYYDGGALYSEEYDDIDYTFTINGNQTIQVYNGGTANARPTITLDGSATSLLFSFYDKDDNLVNSFSYGSFNGVLTVDSMTSLTLLDDVITNSIEGEYPELLPFIKDDIYSQGYVYTDNNTTKYVYIETLDTFDSSVVGQTIFLKCDDKMYSRKISAYTLISTTNGYNLYKLTMEVDLPYAPSGDCEYSIIDESNGFNKIVISGLNLNFTLKFDFRYTYA